MSLRVFWPEAATVGSSAASRAVKSPVLAMSLTEGGHLVAVNTNCRPSVAFATLIKGTSVAFVLLLGSS